MENWSTDFLVLVDVRQPFIRFDGDCGYVENAITG
jgi:hypothetical protein